MADNSHIEWTDATWNPVTGCSVVSPGCTNCYAMKLAGTRLAHHESRAGLTVGSKTGPVWNGKVRLNGGWLGQPLLWKRPRDIFVCAHGDLFHPAIPDEWIDIVFSIMAMAPQHRFQVLTKRADRMRQYVRTMVDEPHRDSLRRFAAAMPSPLPPLKTFTIPLPNVWLGVSAEDQQRADERIPELLATPAAVRFVSLEPLLGPIDVSRYAWPVCGWWRAPYSSYAEAKAAGGECGLKRQALVHADATFLDWVIVGGESGKAARPFDTAWAESIVQQCLATGVACFVKQLGAHVIQDGERRTKRDKKGGDISEWPHSIRVREMPNAT